jgi:hypothetical protein
MDKKYWDFLLEVERILKHAPVLIRMPPFAYQNIYRMKKNRGRRA